MLFLLFILFIVQYGAQQSNFEKIYQTTKDNCPEEEFIKLQLMTDVDEFKNQIKKFNCQMDMYYLLQDTDCTLFNTNVCCKTYPNTPGCEKFSNDVENPRYTTQSQYNTRKSTENPRYTTQSQHSSRNTQNTGEKPKHTTQSQHNTRKITERPRYTTQSQYNTRKSTEKPKHTTQSQHNTRKSTERPRFTTKSQRNTRKSTERPRFTTQSQRNTRKSTERPRFTTQSQRNTRKSTERPRFTTQSQRNTRKSTERPRFTTQSQRNTRKTQNIETRKPRFGDSEEGIPQFVKQFLINTKPTKTTANKPICTPEAIINLKNYDNLQKFKQKIKEIGCVKEVKEFVDREGCDGFVKVVCCQAYPESGGCPSINNNTKKSRDIVISGEAPPSSNKPTTTQENKEKSTTTTQNKRSTEDKPENTEENSENTENTEENPENTEENPENTENTENGQNCNLNDINSEFTKCVPSNIEYCQDLKYGAKEEFEFLQNEIVQLSKQLNNNQCNQGCKCKEGFITDNETKKCISNIHCEIKNHLHKIKTVIDHTKNYWNKLKSIFNKN